MAAPRLPFGLALGVVDAPVSRAADGGDLAERAEVRAGGERDGPRQEVAAPDRGVEEGDDAMEGDDRFSGGRRVEGDGGGLGAAPVPMSRRQISRNRIAYPMLNP